MDERDHDRERGVEQFDRRAAERLQGLVDEPGRAQQHAPAKGAHHHRNQQWGEDHEQEDRAPADRPSGQDVGLGHADHRADQGRQGGDPIVRQKMSRSTGAREDRRVVIEGEARLDASAVIVDVE